MRFAATVCGPVLSVAGVAVGIAAVVALTALGEGARRYVVQEFSSLGSNLLIVLPGKVETTGMMPFGGTVHDLTIDDYRAVATRIPLVQRAAPLATGEETLRYGGKARSVPVIGTTEELLEVRRLRVGAGRFLPPGDPEPGGRRNRARYQGRPGALWRGEPARQGRAARRVALPGGRRPRAQGEVAGFRF